MAEKDFREKKFISFNDIFADIINVLLFNGSNRVKDTDLQSGGMLRSGYKVDDRFAEQERDVKKYWLNGSVRLAVLGIENQTDQDSDFIFRGIGYDGAEYREQLRRRAEIKRQNAKLKAQRKAGTNNSRNDTHSVDAGDDARKDAVPLPDFYPVVTIVLYFGDTHWNQSLNLKDHLNIPEGLEPYVSDYKVNLFEIAFLTDEQVQAFQSDFRYVAEYFVENRKRKEGLEPQITITLEHLKHVEEFIELMNAITNSDRFSSLPKLIKERGDEAVYTILFDEAEARGIAIGEKRGEERGEKRGEDNFATLISKLFSLGRIADAEKAANDENYRAKLFKEFQIN